MADQTIRNFFSDTLWAIVPSALQRLFMLAERGEPDPECLRLTAQNVAATQTQPGAVAVIPIEGTITQKPMGGLMGMLFSGATTTGVAAMFRAAQADPGVRSILLAIDSPGGQVEGVEELAAEILKARGQKPVVAIANSVAASAAFWIASAADEIVVTPSGQVGSIGILVVHEDISKMAEDKGVKVTMISAGKFKTEGNPFEPLGDEAKAFRQKRVDETFATFTAAVAKGRGVAPSTVRNGFGEGRVVGAKEALALGMVDKIATFEETLGRMASGRGITAGRTRAEAATSGLVMTDDKEPSLTTTSSEIVWIDPPENDDEERILSRAAPPTDGPLSITPLRTPDQELEFRQRRLRHAERG